MLHSGLPRAYLAGGPAALGYLAGYFDDGQPIAATTYTAYNTHHHQRIDEQQPYLQQRYLAWDAAATTTTNTNTTRGPSPCPLDLSLKPPPTPGTPPPPPTSSLLRVNDDCEPIEVDDEDERRSREEARSRHSLLGDRRSSSDIVIPDEELSCSSGHSYHQPTLGAYVQQQQQLKQPTSQMLIEMSGLTGYPYHHHYQQQQQQQQHQHHHQLPAQPLLQTPQQVHAPMTPPSTPSPPQCPRRKHRDDESSGNVTPGASPRQQQQQQSDKPPRPKKKHARRLKFDEDTSSPVSGTVILGPDEAVVTGDIDPAFNIVEVTDEARAELAKIENRLGPYQCKLCQQLHDDAFQLAQHRCSRIAHVEYRCPECDKRFSCPANLASHRRWHKPRPPPPSQTAATTGAGAGDDGKTTGDLACTRCDAKFNRQAALRKHMAAQHPSIVTEQNNNNELDANNKRQQQQFAHASGSETMA